MWYGVAGSLIEESCCNGSQEICLPAFTNMPLASVTCVFIVKHDASPARCARFDKGSSNIRCAKKSGMHTQSFFFPPCLRSISLS